jgi:hypothetical protein
LLEKKNTPNKKWEKYVNVMPLDVNGVPVDFKGKHANGSGGI